MDKAFRHACAALATIACTATAAPSPAQDRIQTLERGTFICELPGDAEGKAGIRQEDAGFTIASASRYLSPQGSGTYLRRGEVVEMTSGPRSGERYRVVSERFLRKLEGGKMGRLRCIKQGGRPHR